MALFEGWRKHLQSQEGIPKGFIEILGMKIIKQIGKQGSRCLIKLSQQEWQEIGNQTGWDADIDKAEPTKLTEPSHPAENTETIKTVPEPIALSDIGKMDVTVEKYSDRSFAVYVSGDLLCVTMYKKGAMAVKSLLERMQEDLVGLDMMARFHTEKSEKLERENAILKEKLDAKQNGLIPVLVKERDTSQSGG